MAILAKQELIGVDNIPADIRAPKGRAVGLSENDWSDLRKQLMFRQPDGKCELVDARKRKKIRLTEEELKRANDEGKSLPAVRDEIYRDLIAQVVEETEGDIPTMENILNRNERTIKDTLSELGIPVQEKEGQFVIANGTAA
jgi:DNA-binding NtrC family response regulator